LDRDFVAGVPWPIDPGSLAALLDMGLSYARIGVCFSVPASDVEALTKRYGFGC
jgi:hypothetical protein